MTAKKTLTPQSKRLLELEQQLKQRIQQSDQILELNKVSLEVIWEAFCEQQSMLETLLLESSKQSEVINQQSDLISQQSLALTQEQQAREQLQTTMMSLTQSVTSLIDYFEKKEAP